jgi:hypothetical protein
LSIICIKVIRFDDEYHNKQQENSINSRRNKPWTFVSLPIHPSIHHQKIVSLRRSTIIITPYYFWYYNLQHYDYLTAPLFPTFVVSFILFFLWLIQQPQQQKIMIVVYCSSSSVLRERWKMMASPVCQESVIIISRASCLTTIPNYDATPTA